MVCPEVVILICQKTYQQPVGWSSPTDQSGLRETAHSLAKETRTLLADDNQKTINTIHLACRQTDNMSLQIHSSQPVYFVPQFCVKTQCVPDCFRAACRRLTRPACRLYSCRFRRASHRSQQQWPARIAVSSPVQRDCPSAARCFPHTGFRHK